jgi:hypothetical protein
MAEVNKPKDFKERFEFKLTIGDFIVCQRYFKINNFNPTSLNSFELANTIRYCANLIDEDLKSKSRIYMWHTAPLVFKNEDEMYKWFANPENSKTVRKCENVFLRESDTEYLWDAEKLVPCEGKINNGEYTSTLTNEDVVTLKLAFIDNGREVVSTVWDGVYPRDVRNSIDLSNNKGKFEGEDVSRLGFESALLNYMVQGKIDLIWKIIREIQITCSDTDNKNYTTSESWGYDANGNEVSYRNGNAWYNKYYAKEIAEARKYQAKNFPTTNK